MGVLTDHIRESGIIVFGELVSERKSIHFSIEQRRVFMYITNLIQTSILFFDIISLDLVHNFTVH